MSYLEFAYPDKNKSLPEILGKDGDHTIPPDITPADTGGVHYFTWRNFTAREVLKEKEKHGGRRAVHHNPEPIPASVTPRYQDQNFIQTIQPLQLFRPGRLTESVRSRDNERDEPGLTEIVKYAVQKGLKVKAVGTGHSFSDIMTTPDLLVLTDDLNAMLTCSDDTNKEINIAHYPFLRPYIQDNGYSKVKPAIEAIKSGEYTWETLPDDLLAEDPPRGLVEFQSGIKLFDLNEELWARGWALANLGTYQGQSFIGAVSTSTHGTGIHLPPLPDMIKSLVIVADEGRVFRVEPTIGISNPKLKEPYIDELIQDDDIFNSVLVNVGTFGLVYSVIIEVVPAFYLLETAEITTWRDLKARLIKQHELMQTDPDDELGEQELFVKKEFIAKGPNGAILTVEKIRQTSILLNQNLYNPDVKKEERDKEIFCRITRLYEVPLDQIDGWFDKNDAGRLLSPATKKFLLPVLNCLGEKLERADIDQRNLYKTKLQLICGTVVFAPSNKSKFLGTIETAGMLFGLLDDGHSQQIENIANEARKKAILPGPTQYYLNRGYRVYVKSSDLNGYGIETGFSVNTKIPDVNGNQVPHYIAAIERSLEIARQHWEEGRYIQTGTTAVRFVRSSDAYLSPQYGELTCMIEMLNVADTHGGKELFYRFQKEFEKMGGRPHWGLDLSVTTGNNDFWKRYPKFETWKKYYDIFNSHGTFDNRFTDRMGLSK
jgi:hypothetical protein